MSDVRDFLVWLGSTLVTTIWIGNCFADRYQYFGILIDLPLRLSLSILVGSILFLTIRKLLYLVLSTIVNIIYTLITGLRQIRHCEWKVRSGIADLLMK